MLLAPPVVLAPAPPAPLFLVRGQARGAHPLDGAAPPYRPPLAFAHALVFGYAVGGETSTALGAFLGAENTHTHTHTSHTHLTNRTVVPDAYK